MTKKKRTIKATKQAHNKTSNNKSINDFFEQLRREAFIQSVGSSTRLDGLKLSDEEVKALLIESQAKPGDD